MVTLPRNPLTATRTSPAAIKSDPGSTQRLQMHLHW